MSGFLFARSLACWLRLALCFNLFAAGSSAVWAGSDPVVFGWIEKAYVVPLGVITKAKMDSGALTSSINATHVERYKKGGEKWVRFTLSLTDSETRQLKTVTLERPFYRLVKVFGAGGAETRPVVVLEICIGNRRLSEQFTLNDRTDMNYGLLIGRRSMKHIGLLDVNQTFILPPSCPSMYSAGLAE